VCRIVNVCTIMSTLETATLCDCCDACVPGDDGRSQADEEEIDVDKYVYSDSAHVSVKILRKVIPKLRISCYFSDQQMSGKRKCELC